MVFLHPVFTFLIVFLIIYSFYEVYGDVKKTSKVLLWCLGIYMILIIGLRNYVGADYPIYMEMYGRYFPTIDYSELINKMLLRKTDYDIEWLYVFLNKIIYETRSQFYIFTLISAIITIGGKFIFFSKNAKYPVFAILLFVIPGYFIADSGHMRQALGMTVCLLSFRFIKDRQVWWYLLCIYLAFGFHKSSIIFLPAYWLATIPMNSSRIFYAIVICVILSPFQVYSAFSSFLNTMDVQDVSNGFNGYVNYEAKSSSFMDGLVLMFSFLLIAFDKVTCQKIYYYEYARNILVAGVCLYFVMRSNPVFSTRLVGPYFGFAPLVIVSVVFSVGTNTKRIIHIFLIIFTIFYYFVFARYQGVAGRFMPQSYNNILWSN